MILKNDERLSKRLSLLIPKLYKIVPLFEEENSGLGVYVETLYQKLSVLDEVIEIKHTDEYMSILENLKVTSEEVKKGKKGCHKTIRRNSFESCNLLNVMIKKIEKGEENV